MKATHRRAIGMVATVAFLCIWVFFAASAGDLLAAKPWWAQIAFFGIVGVGWVFPLYPLFKWMRRPDPEDDALEKPPEAAALKRR